MAKRSLKASIEGRAKAKKNFDLKGWTQEYLAAEVGLSTRQSVWKFFTGKPIERYIFIEICFKLDLEWEEIADLPQARASIENYENNTLDQIIEKFREDIKQPLESQCCWLQSCLDSSHPIRLEKIFTGVKILPYISNQRWLELEDLQRNFNGTLRHLNSESSKTLPAFEAVVQHSKLIVLGKAGAGKTTFLRHLALQCIKKKFKPDCIPIFITLRNLVSQIQDPRQLGLIEIIQSQWKFSRDSLQELFEILQAGRALILLDGLDEIPQNLQESFVEKLQKFSQDFYKNHIILTCRIAAQQYYFNNFNYVELAGFDPDQIEYFVRSWFQVINDVNPEVQAQEFLEQLERRENLPIRELVSTPILLHLICSVFKERSAFPNKRSRLYQTGLEILLNRWDQARGIKRDQVYFRLSLPQKISLLSQIAASNFEQKKYFFEKTEVLQIIADFLQELPGKTPDPETLWFNSEAVLKSIEVQHGLLVETAKDIYCFSHLTFQEYLTARKISINASHDILEKLASYITDIHWREVILLSVTMLKQTDFLYQKMKDKITQMVNEDRDLQKFLGYIAAKEKQIDSNYNSAAVRAFYFGLIQYRSFDLAIALDDKFSGNLSEEFTLDLTLVRLLTIALSLTQNSDIKGILNFNFALDIEHLLPEDQDLRKSFNKLKQELPDLDIGKESLLSWWQKDGSNWTNNLITWLEKYRHIPVNSLFSPQQKQFLKRYYDANCLLVECLQGDSQVSTVVRKKIVSELLLPGEV